MTHVFPMVKTVSLIVLLQVGGVGERWQANEDTGTINYYDYKIK